MESEGHHLKLNQPLWCYKSGLVLEKLLSLGFANTHVTNHGRDVLDSPQPVDQLINAWHWISICS